MNQKNKKVISKKQSNKRARSKLPSSNQKSATNPTKQTLVTENTTSSPSFKRDILNWEGKVVSQMDIPQDIFGCKLDMALLHTVVHWQRDSKRSGSHNTKTRSEVQGGGRKPFRQKGTGNARQGSIRSPLLEGGGVAHGPKPRNYSWALPKQTRKRALKVALSYLLNEGKLIFLEDMHLETGKTKTLYLALNKMGLNKALLVDQKQNENLKRACKNLKQFKFISVEGVNVYDLLKFDKVVFTPTVLKSINAKYGVH